MNLISPQKPQTNKEVNRTLKNIGIADVKSNHFPLGWARAPKDKLPALEAESQTLLERAQLSLTEWQRSCHGIALAELTGNLPSGTCQKSAIYLDARKSCSWEGIWPATKPPKGCQGMLPATACCWLLCVLQRSSAGEATCVVEQLPMLQGQGSRETACAGEAGLAAGAWGQEDARRALPLVSSAPSSDRA